MLIDKNRILVIGSKNHNSAGQCINWGEQIYIGDFDLVIINMATLDDIDLEGILNEDVYYFDNLKKLIMDAQKNKILRVICISNEMIVSTKMHPSIGRLINSYDWSPIIPIFEENPGKRIDVKKSKLQLEYFKLINGWERLYEKYHNNTGITDSPNNSSPYVMIDVRGQIFNELGRFIAFEAIWKICRNKYPTVEFSSTPILFLPKIEDLRFGIDSIISNFTGEEDEEAPEWVEDVELPGKAELERSINDYEVNISELQGKIKNESDKLEKLNEYRKLLYASGKPLENIVEKSFDLLGIHIDKIGQSSKEDGIFIEDDAEIPIEIRGKDNSGLKEADLNQVTGRLADKPISEKYKTRGVFILNHFRHFPLDVRESAFHPNIVEKAKSWSICLITTEDMFKLVKLELEGRPILDIKNKIFNSVGIFNIEGY